MLHEAVREQGDLQIIESLLSHGLDVNAKDLEGSNPLHYAEHASVIQLLVDKGATVNGKNFAGDTLLHVMLGRTRRSTELGPLLKLGPSPKARDTNGTMPRLHPVLQRPVKRPMGVSSIFMSMSDPYDSEENRTNVLKVLVEEWADVNAISLQGSTPLHCAMQNAQVENAKILLVVGAQPSIQDIHGRTPLDMAVGPLPLDILDKRTWP